MNKQLRFTYNDKEYVLEYTRKSVETLERQGFMASDITEKPMSTLPKLFAGAFIVNHPYTSKNIIDNIFSKMTNRQELIGKLAEMYNEPIMALVDEPEENEGNLNWTASW